MRSSKTGRDLLVLLDELLLDPPPVHGDPAPRGIWATDEELYRDLIERLPPDPVTLETGAGISTLLLAAGAKIHHCITPASSEIAVLKQAIAARSLAPGSVVFHVDRSDRILPRLETDLDLVLIDGGHAYPTPQIDWFYAGSRLRRGDCSTWTTSSCPRSIIWLLSCKGIPAGDCCGAPRNGACGCVATRENWRKSGPINASGVHRPGAGSSGCCGEPGDASRGMPGAPPRHALCGTDLEMPAAPLPPPLRVAQLVETLAVGGAERLAVQIAADRARAGDRSLILVLGGPGPLASQVDPRVTVRYLHLERASITAPTRFLASLRRGLTLLGNEISRENLQVVQSHLPNANFWGLLLALRRRVAVIPTVHNNNEFYYGDMKPPRVRSRLRRWAYRLMLRRCPAMIAVSSRVADSLLREIGGGPHLARNLHVVPNGVALPDALDHGARASLRERFGCRPGDLFVLAAGRHSEQKNFKVLIDAAGLLRERHENIRIVIAGDGELRPAHQEQISRMGLDDVVNLPGNLDDLPLVMQAADVFVLPSLWEGLPLVLLEAMAAGTPVLGTDIDGVRDVIVDGESGLLCAVNSPHALADALMRLQDSALRSALSASGLALFQRSYSFERVSAQIDDLYRRAARTHGPPGRRPTA